MTTCTYKFKDASGEEVTITGQADMKAFLANGGLEQLLPGKVLPWGGKQSTREKYSGPIDVSSRNGQMELANRAGTIASLKGMNAQLRAIDPSEAWADSNIEQSSDLDALRDQISEALVKASRGKQQENPLRKRLEEASGQELKAVFDVMGLAGARMLHGDRVDALMAEDAKAVSDALDSVMGVDATTNSDDKPAKQTSSIEDFGAKLAGARKDMQASISKEWSDDEIASQPFSKVWPAADIDAIEDPFEASVMFAAREEIPAKPRVAYKVKAWVAKVKMFRELVSRVIGKVGRERFLGGMKEYGGLDGFRAKVMLLEAIDRSQWKRIGRVDEYPDAYTFNDDGTKTKTPQVVVEIDGRRERFEGSRNVLDALDKINEKLGTAADPKKMQFEVRGREGMYSINKKGDREYRKLKTFATTKEAFAYIKDNYDDLVAAWDGVKDRDNVGKGDVRNETNRPRTGSDYRNGKDVTPEQFGDTFGFRGVQFGNWVSQGAGGKDRQGMLNQAYDALMDLANIAGIPPKAVSLNGSLGLAFGSRGNGWASAHFEPDKLVINLTKTRGAGTLAHEWFHALDNYFSRQRGGEVRMRRGINAQEAYRTQNFITYRPEPMYVHKTKQSAPVTKAQLDRYHAQAPESGYYNPENWQIDPSHPQGVRPEVERAFADLVETLDNSPMKARSAKNGKGADGYWSRIIERGARSFENYVIHKMRMNGYDNDYLANVRKVDDFARDAGRYPYLLDEEVAPVAEAFDALFSEIKTKETEQGVALYEIDKNGDPSPEEAEAVQRGLEGKNPIEAAAWLAENAPMKFAVIAEKVRDKLQSLADAGVNFGLSIVRPGDLGEAGLSVARGVTAPVRNGDRVDIRIALNGAGMTGRVGTSYRTATHELAHAATMQSVQLGMSGSPQYAQAMRDLVDVANAIGDHLRSRMKADKETWTDFERAVFEKRANFMRSVDEVLVWGMTSPEAQAYLESIPYKSKSLWTSFVEAVRKVLGLSAHSDTALSEVLRIADVLLKPIDMDSLAGFVGLDSQYEIQQPYGGRVFKNPGGVPDAKWTGEAVDEGAARLSERTAVLRDTSALRDGESIPRDQAEAFIRSFVAEFPGAPPIMLADSFSQLPKDLQADAISQGSNARRAKGALKAGKAFVVLNNHHSMADLEATVFHEILGHTGIRKLLGPQFSQELNKLFVGLGGYSGLERIMEARGMGQQFEGYFRGIQQARASNPDAWTDALAKSILTEEVFAHIAEQKNAKQLRDRFMALVGMVRDWLRRHGFMDLASLGESDIVFMLQHAREGLRDGSGIVRDGATVGENEIVGEDGRPIAKEGSPEYEALKLLSGRLGLRERSGPTVFKDGLRDDGNEGQDAGMDDANNVAGKQAPNPAGDVEGSAQWAYETYQSGAVPDGWYVHGRQGRKDLNTGGVLQLTRDWDVADQYSGQPGSSKWLIRPKSEANTLDLSGSQTADMDRVVDAALRDFDRNRLPWLDDLEAAIGREAEASDVEDAVRDNFAPDNIVDSAKAYDSQSMSEWLAETFDYPSFVETPDGAVVFSRKGIDAVMVPSEPSTSARPDVAVFRTDTSPSSKAADGALLRTINTAGGRKTVRGHLADAFSNVTGESARTLNWWQRTIGSQSGKAKSDKDFGRVYDAAHAFLDGVSAFAKEASERASGILPHLDTWRDVSAGLNVKKQWADSQDYQAIAPAIFDGTLANGTTGKVWTDEQLRDKYNLNDKQIGHYREFRAAVDFSLETLAASEMARMARASKMDAADRDMGMDDALSFYLKQLDPRIKAARDAVEGKGGEIVDRHTEERAALEEAAAYLTEGAADLLRNEMQSRHDKEIDEVMGAERSLENLRASFTEKVEQIRKLQSEGYAPLMRFGQYTVDVARLDDEGHPLLDEDGNPDRPFFGMFESESEARKAEKILTEEYPGYSVTRGVLSTEANQLYRGLTPETAEMFARLLGTDENEAFQAYLKQAVANRSAMKRLINRMGIEGFATDVPRVLSAFITSNARLSSGNWHFGEMSKAVEAIPKHKGDVKTDAVKLMQYVQNPVEEAAGLRGFLFFSFLGGSVASAVVNLTQTFTTTLPYLSQFGAGDVAKALPKAMALSGRMMKKGLDAVSDKDLKDALRKASDEGVVDPQEIHLLMAEASGNGASVGLSGLAGAINKEWATPAARVTRSLTQAWGMLFGAAEKYNRHVAFIAAWEVAPEGVDRYEFAKNAVTETQFDYTKASRPNWARGAVGATLFTFKTFSINYVEFMSRLPPRERAIALGVLFLLAGMSGMPGADDLDDVVDTVAQKMGYNWNNAAARHAWLVRTLGTGGADFVERGVSSMLPLDVSARLGMGNLVPGTGVLQKSNTSPVRDVQEFFGPAGSVVAGFRDVFDNAGSGKGVIDTALPLMPKMFKDLRQAVDMVQTGQYRDMKGRKVVDVDGVDAVLKGIGFQPNSVASPRRIERMLAQSAGMQRVIRQDISELWARGVAEQDAEKVASARTILREWNEKNPESKITMNPTSIAQRVRAMRLTSADRLVKATPKDMRGALAAEMAVQQ